MKKAASALPSSPSKKKAVLSKLISSLPENEQKDIFNFVSHKEIGQKPEFKSLICKEIEEFFTRDDISRVSPKTRDTKEYADLNSGEMVLLPLRHMVLTLKEAHAVFCEERRQEVKCK